MTLCDAVQDPQRRAAMAADGIGELEAELEARSGLGSLAIRTGYRTLRKIRPQLVEQNLERLLPRFAPILDPYVAEGRTRGDVNAHFAREADAIAEQLLSVTDARAAESGNRVAVRAYEKLRPKAKDNVVEGMPRLARLADRYADG